MCVSKEELGEVELVRDKLLLKIIKEGGNEYFLVDRRAFDDLLDSLAPLEDRMSRIEELCNNLGSKLSKKDFERIDKRIAEFYWDEQGLRYVGYGIVRRRSCKA
jgi:hypothetical protein